MYYLITQISQAKKNTERVNIYLNGKFWIGLNKNDLIALKLTNDQKISELEKQEIENTSSVGKIIDKAINYIQIRPRSCAEVRDYLVLKKKVPDEEAESVIVRLQDRNLLSDEKFAQWYVDYKTNSGINGINKIKAELFKKRVNIKIINGIFEKLYNNDEFKTNQSLKIEEYTKKIIKTIKAKDSYELKTKLTRRLMARGFKYDDIKKIL